MTDTIPTSSACSSVVPDDSPVDEKDMPATDRAIEQLFDGIDAIYFMGTGFKAISHELEKLSAICPELEIDELERERFKLKRQMQVVSKKMSALIVKNSLDFNRQVENYENVRTNAEQLLRITRRMRGLIDSGKRKCRVLASILAFNCKRRVSLLVKRELALIAALRDGELEARRRLLQTDDIWAFLKVIIGVIDAARHFQHYSSVKQISHTLLGVLRTTEGQIDAAFAEQTKLFKLERYTLLSRARTFLGNIELASVKLRDHFNESLCAASRMAVLDALLQTSTSPTNAEQSDVAISNLPLEQLCQRICPNDFLHILCKVGSALVDILRTYHTILKFHADEDKATLTNSGQNEDDWTGQSSSSDHDHQLKQSSGRGTDNTDNFDAQPLVEKGVMQKSLIDNAFDVFECAATQNFNCLLTNVEMSTIKFDQFIKIIDLLERFRSFGHKYFGNPGEPIQETLVVQSRKYIERYHAEKMEEVKMFLESETFTLCPVPVQFTLFDLPEFFFLKEFQQQQQQQNENDAQQIVEETDNEQQYSFESFVHGRTIRFMLFDRLSGGGGTMSASQQEYIFPLSVEQYDESPRRIANSRREGDTTSISYCSSFDDGTRNSVDDDGVAACSLPPHNTMPNLCNSTLNLMRVIGRFLQMATVLRSTAELTVESIVALLNCYILSIYRFFCTDFDVQQQEQMFGTNFVSLRLRQFVQSVEKGWTAASGQENAATNEQQQNPVVHHFPSLCHALDINDADKLFLLTERIVGVESTVFLAKQMELLRPFLETLLLKRGGDANNLNLLDSFYRFLPAVFDLGDASFGCVAAKVLPSQSILKQILATDWTADGDIKHSPYVDTIVKEFSLFKQKFVRLCPYVHISNELFSSIWSMLLLCTVRTLVQGYADAKKCSIEGRALQLLDVEQLCAELEEMTGLRPLPHRPFVENFVKAFYLPLGELQNWIVHHTEYSLSQTSAILNAAAASNNSSSSAGINSTKATMSRIMANLLDASGIGEGSHSLFQ